MPISDLPLCFQIQMQALFLINTSPPFVSLPLALWLVSLHSAYPLHSLSPFHLIPSCSQFAFSIFETLWSHCQPRDPPRDWTLGLLTFFLSPLYISPYNVINPLPLSLSLSLHPLHHPPPPGPAYLAPFLFLLAVLFLFKEKRKEKKFFGQGWSKSFVTWYSLLGPSLPFFDSFS